MNWTQSDIDKKGFTKQADGTFKKSGTAKLIGDSVVQINKNVKRISQPIRGTMNKWEASYAKTLDLELMAGEIKSYYFEKVNLKLANRTWYCPDFTVIMPNGETEFHEVKGRWMDDARVKIKVAAQQFPEYQFLAVTRAKDKSNGEWEYERFYSS